MKHIVRLSFGLISQETKAFLSGRMGSGLKIIMTKAKTIFGRDDFHYLTNKISTPKTIVFKSPKV